MKPLQNVNRLYFVRVRFLRAAFAPSLPRAVRVFLGRCATVLFRRAALAAFLIFRFAATRCFLVVMSLNKQVGETKKIEPEVIHSRQYPRLGARSDLSCRKNRRMQGTQNSAQFPQIGRPDRVERLSQTFRHLSKEMSTE